MPLLPRLLFKPKKGNVDLHLQKQLRKFY